METLINLTLPSHISLCSADDRSSSSITIQAGPGMKLDSGRLQRYMAESSPPLCDWIGFYVLYFFFLSVFSVLGWPFSAALSAGGTQRIPRLCGHDTPRRDRHCELLVCLPPLSPSPHSSCLPFHLFYLSLCSFSPLLCARLAASLVSDRPTQIHGVVPRFFLLLRFFSAHLSVVAPSLTDTQSICLAGCCSKSASPAQLPPTLWVSPHLPATLPAPLRPTNPTFHFALSRVALHEVPDARYRCRCC